MQKKTKAIRQWLKRVRIQSVRLLRKIVLPGFDGMPLYDVLSFFFKGLFNGVLTYRAAAISYNFFLALIPFVLFLFTLIPFVISTEYQSYVLELLKELIPANIYGMVQDTLEGIIKRPQQGLLSAGFVMSVYFATNGVDAIIEGFNQSYHRPETRPWWKQKILAFFLMLMLSVLIIISISFLGFGEVSIGMLQDKNIITNGISIFFLELLRWFIILVTIFIGVSTLYYFGYKTDLKKKKKKYHFFSPGSILATVLFVFGGLLIKMYFENFTRYNLVYGSIGSLIVLMVWIYYNSFIILIGFELNVSIDRTKQKLLSEIKYRRV